MSTRARTGGRGSARGRLPLLPVVVVGIVVVLVAALLIAALGGDDDEPRDATVAETRPVTVSGETLPTFPGGLASPDDPAIGLVAPTLSGQDFEGDPVTIAPDESKKMILFVAHTCPHCRAEIPRLRAWLDSHEVPAGVGLYLVSSNVQPSGPNYPPSEWLARERMDGVPTLADDEANSAITAYGISGFPYLVMLDGDGRVVSRLSGELGGSGEAFTGLFEALAAGDPIVDPRA
jgi:thiol-disulfide isomerase/thioredoxin